MDDANQPPDAYEKQDEGRSGDNDEGPRLFSLMHPLPWLTIRRGFTRKLRLFGVCTMSLAALMDRGVV